MTERREFEAWANTLELNVQSVMHGGALLYSDCNTDYAWLAWQAARATPAPAQPEPMGEPVALKDGQVAALVNELRDIAIKFHGAGQLRERIAQVIRPLFRSPPAASTPAVPEPSPGAEGDPIAEAILKGLTYRELRDKALYLMALNNNQARTIDELRAAAPVEGAARQQALKEAYDVMFDIKGDKVTRFDAQTAIRNLMAAPKEKP